MEAAAPDLQAAYYGFLYEAEGLPPSAPLAPQDLAALEAAALTTSSGKGRKRGAKQLEDGDSDELSDEEEGEAFKRSGKKGRAPGSEAARTKASRERARREKINDRFVELAQLVEPNKEPKTDKMTVLSEAIRTVQQLHVENHQLKQLNKFLEEKVASLERERTQSMYFQMQAGMMQQAGMVGHGGGVGHPMGGMVMQQPAAAPPMMMAAPPQVGVLTMLQPQGMVVQQQQQQQERAQGQQQPPPPPPPPQQQQQQQVAEKIARATSGALQPHAQMQHPQQPLAPGPAGGLHIEKEPQAQSLPQQLQQQHPAGDPGLAPPMADTKPTMAGMGMGPPGGYAWQSMVPQAMLDANQDSLLRPPAA